MPQPFPVGFSGMEFGTEGPGELREVGVVVGTSQPNPFVPCPQLEVSLEEIPDEGLLVSWAFTDRPDLSLTVLPKLQAREVREQGWERRGRAGEAGSSGGCHLFVLFSMQRGEEQVELSTIEELIRDAIVSTQPAMMVSLKACSAPGGLVSRCLKQTVGVHAVPGTLLFFLPPPSHSYPVRSHPWWLRPSQPCPD